MKWTWSVKVFIFMNCNGFAGHSAAITVEFGGHAPFAFSWMRQMPEQDKILESHAVTDIQSTKYEMSIHQVSYSPNPTLYFRLAFFASLQCLTNIVVILKTRHRGPPNRSAG